MAYKLNNNVTVYSSWQEGRIVLALVLLLALASPAQAAIAFVQRAVCSGNDCTGTFPTGWTSGNVVLVASAVFGQADTFDVQGISATETVIGDIVNIGTVHGLHFRCFVVAGADIGDTNFIATTSGTASQQLAAIEVSGATCTEDGADTANTDTASPYPLTTDITTTATGSILFGIIASGTASNFTADTGTTGVGVSGETADIPVGDNTGFALGGFQIAGVAGAYEISFTSAASENTTMGAFAVLAAAEAGGGSRNLMLLGVGD